uniref:FAD-binding PCMH-type domain-containing protein n=1 Tax=Quercus lobata TaxID=97700 RepID=A0A7N2MSC1_QUELO
MYTPNNDSYFSILQAYVRNLRFNTTTTQKPFLILTALHESHIQAAIVCAQKQNLQMKTRSGGHDYEGVSYVSEVQFFVLDMFNLRSIHIDMESETAWVQAGATLGELYYRIYEKSKSHGFPAGVCPTVGVGGHFSGGGYGMMRSMASQSITLSMHNLLMSMAHFTTEHLWEKICFGLLEWQHVADKLDENLSIRLILDMVNGTNGEKNGRATFIALFLGDSEQLLSIMNKSFPELGLKKSDCNERSWVQSVLFWTNFDLGPPNEILLSRVPQTLSCLKRKSEYLKEHIPKDGLELIWKKLIELEYVTLAFNPYGGRMSEIPAEAAPFPHREGNLAKIQYLANCNEGGKEVTDYHINLTRKLYSFMTPFVSKNPRDAYFNYKDLDLGINNHNGKASYKEGRAYGIKNFNGNFDRLVKIKTKVDPGDFFRN